MVRLLLSGALLGSLLACDTSGPVTTCPPGVLCTRPASLVVTGTLQASLHPIPDAEVTVVVFTDHCGGTPALVAPSPATDTTDAAGHYRLTLFATDPVPAACVRLAYSSALFRDTAGVSLRVNPAHPETLQLDLVGP